MYAFARMNVIGRRFAGVAHTLALALCFSLVLVVQCDGGFSLLLAL